MATWVANRMRSRVILLPGGVLPAQLAYADLIAALGSDVEAIAKELEMYAGPEPPPGYTLDSEVAGIIRTADDAGFDRFHLVGYSGGGAASLAFVAAHPERLLSLALIEPAWLGNEGLDAQEQAVWREFERIMDLPPDQMMPAFVATQLAPGVEPPPPPPGPRPPWMATRPAGLRTFLKVFLSSNLDLERLRAFTKPVLFVVGGRSNPDYYGREAERASKVFPDFALEVFPERHHFDPPHRIEPKRTAAVLRNLWARAAIVA
jgi:pimeloyl-ACP methyl ester carboxylesterase